MATTYQINFTDPASGSIAIAPSTANGPVAGQTLTGSEQTDIRLLGENVCKWGEAINENLIKLLENFAIDEGSPGVPKTSAQSQAGYGINNPIVGQLWFNKTDQSLYVYTSSGWTEVGSGIGALPSQTAGIIRLEAYSDVYPGSLDGPQTYIIGTASSKEWYQAPLDPYGMFPSISSGNPITQVTIPAGFTKAIIRARVSISVPNLNFATGSGIISSSLVINGSEVDERHCHDKMFFGNSDYTLTNHSLVTDIDTGIMNVSAGDVIEIKSIVGSYGTLIDYMSGAYTTNEFFTGNYLEIALIS